MARLGATDGDYLFFTAVRGIRPSAFAGFRFPPDVIVLAVRWYLRFGLS
jgi:transposase-like protein